MSSIKIKDLPEKTTKLEDEDLLIIEDNEDTKKISLIKLKSAFSMDGILVSMKNMLLEKINSFTESHSTKYKELEERNKQLEANCNNLENEHIHDANRIFKLENELIIQQGLNSTLQANCDDLLKKISVLQTQRDTLVDESINLNNQLVFNTNLINGLQTKIANLQKETKEIKDKYDELQTLLDSMQSASTDIIDKNFNEANDEISSMVEDLMTYIRYYHPDVDNLEVK